MRASSLALLLVLVLSVGAAASTGERDVASPAASAPSLPLRSLLPGSKTASIASMGGHQENLHHPAHRKGHGRQDRATGECKAIMLERTVSVYCILKTVVFISCFLFPFLLASGKRWQVKNCKGPAISFYPKRNDRIKLGSILTALNQSEKTY